MTSDSHLSQQGSTSESSLRPHTLHGSSAAPRNITLQQMQHLSKSAILVKLAHRNASGEFAPGLIATVLVKLAHLGTDELLEILGQADDTPRRTDLDEASQHYVALRSDHSP